MASSDRWAGMIPMQAQSEILSEMANAMAESIAGEWDHATYVITRLGGQGSGDFQIFDEDGQSRQGSDWTTFDLADDLRRVMFVEGRGSWFTMTLTVDHSGSVSADFDYENPPDFESAMLGVTGYSVATEQHDFPRDRAHQPQWYSVLLDEFLDAQQARLDMVAVRDRGWAAVGLAGPESNSMRLVVLSSGVGVVATGGYSDPSENHPGDPGFELYMPSLLFSGDVDQACEAWPARGLGYVVMMTTDEDIDWRARTADGLYAVTYVPNFANTTPSEWRGEDDVCGILVGVPYPGVPDVLEGPQGPIALVGVVPARPAEWAYMRSGGVSARREVGERLSQLDPLVLASPDRPSVV